MIADNGVIPEEWQPRYDAGYERGRNFAETATLAQVVDRIRLEVGWLQVKGAELRHPDQDRQMDAAYHYYYAKGLVKALRDALAQGGRT